MLILPPYSYEEFYIPGARHPHSALNELLLPPCLDAASDRLREKEPPRVALCDLEWFESRVGVHHARAYGHPGSNAAVDLGLAGLVGNDRLAERTRLDLLIPVNSVGQHLRRLGNFLARHEHETPRGAESSARQNQPLTVGVLDPGRVRDLDHSHDTRPDPPAFFHVRREDHCATTEIHKHCAHEEILSSK